jgi:hypothetical protein
VNSMSIEDMDDAGGRNCHETADMRALWSPTNFIPEDQVRFYQSILTMITSLPGGSEALCLILWIFGNRIRHKAKVSGLRTLKSWTEEDLGSRLEINWQWVTQNLCIVSIALKYVITSYIKPHKYENKEKWSHQIPCSWVE